ncbi:hypothetical protein BJV82DRAFT_656263 [Fennellomyces sp. T-0311]|nr:hypothetical protein BJV82DRAFT_656263 [Fennellomyces sp. T-0311]
MGKNKNKENTGQKDVWDIRVSKSETAMAERNFEEVITSSTWALNKLMENQVLRLLELRATAYEKKGLLSRALEDATKMIQYVPTSPTGYLTAGRILMTHGKPSVAVDHYKKGLHAVPNFHRQYKQIQEECTIATARTQQRFDIVARLPRELVYKVLTHLDPERVWVCLNVSTKWCEQVSRCGTWWSTVVVKQTGTEIDQAVCDAIPLVKDYIQQLELANMWSTSLNKKYLAHLKYGIFTNIKMLSLKGAFFKDIVSEDLAIALWQTRGTLTSLKVDFESGKSFPLLVILGSCPDITELCYTTTGTIELWNGGNEYGSGCKKLLNLELYCGSTSYRTLCCHLAVCPNLRRLIIKFRSAQSLYDWSSGTFMDYCPKLRILGLNYAEQLPEVNDYGDLADSWTQNPEDYKLQEYHRRFHQPPHRMRTCQPFEDNRNPRLFSQRQSCVMVRLC